MNAVVLDRSQTTSTPILTHYPTMNLDASDFAKIEKAADLARGTKAATDRHWKPGEVQEARPTSNLINIRV
jgi:hypothetical protein